MERKKKGFSNGPGFYIALCCCVIAIGAAGYFTSRNEDGHTVEEHQIMEIPASTKAPEKTAAPTPEPSQAPTPEPKSTEAAPAPKVEVAAAGAHTEAAEEEVPASAAAEPEIIEAGEPVDFYEGSVVEAVTINDDPVFMWPVQGETADGFSGDALVYSNAMGDWRTHNGIDIKAAEGTDVLAADDGIIEQAYMDFLGNTIVIDHQNGYKTRYANVQSIEDIPIGGHVAKGDVIGQVGSYSLGENVTEPHLHFEIQSQSGYLDPNEFCE